MFFYNLKPFYLIDESILVEFDVATKKETDWIGLFPLGWTSLESYITFEWVSESLNLPWAVNKESHCQALLFHPQYHSHAVTDSMLYQFVYVSQQIEVLGKSGPFKFRFQTLADGCGKNSMLYTAKLPEFVLLKKENLALQQRCQTAEEGTRSSNFICLSDLISSLETQTNVQIVSGGKKVWVRKVNPNEKQVEIMRCTPTHASTPRNYYEKLYPLLDILKKFCTSTEDRLFHAANSLAGYFQLQSNGPIRLAPVPDNYPNQGNLSEKISEIFGKHTVPTAGSITWKKADNALDLELSLDSDKEE